MIWYFMTEHNVSAGGRKSQGHVKQAAKGKHKEKNLENIKHIFSV